MSKIINVVVNSFVNDARVTRTAILGKAYADEVVVLALHEKGLKKREIINGIKVVRLKLITKSLPKKTIFHFLKFFEFNVRALFFLIRANPQLIHAHDLSALPIGFLAKKVTRSKIIYDSHELFLSRAGKVPLIKPALFIEKYIIKKVDLAITVSDSISDLLKDHYKLNKRPLVIRNVPNYKEVNRLREVLRKKLNIDKDQFVFVYQGGVQLDRGIELLIKAIDIIDNPKFTLVIIGNGSLKDALLESAGATTTSSNILFQDAVPHNELHYWTMGGNAGVSPIIGKSLSYKYCLPNKVFEYIRAGLPLIVSDLPDMKRIVEKYKVGICFRENDINDLIQKMNLLYTDFELRTKLANNSEETAKELNWEKESELLKEQYSLLLRKI